MQGFVKGFGSERGEDGQHINMNEGFGKPHVGSL